jgi:hypothetical protein
VFTADDGPHARADVWQVGGQVHGLDTVGESSRKTWDGQAGELGADGQDTSIRLTAKCE